MYIDQNIPEYWTYTVTLDGEPVGVVQAADTEEGWIQQIMTNWYRESLGMPTVNSEEESKPVRRYGKVELRCGTCGKPK